jgi:chromate transport protein ChrA
MIYWQLILVYLKIGMFGFGGGYAMLSLIQYEVVDHHSLNIFSEILFYRLSLYISRLQMYSFGLNIHEISRF